MIVTSRTIAAAGCGVLAAAPMAACGICMLAAVDYVAPPAFLWFWLPVSWFVLTSIVTSVAGVGVAFIPGILGSFALAFAALIVGSAFLGPVATVPLAIPCAALFVKSLGRRVEWPSGVLRRGVMMIGAVHVLAMTIGVVFAVRTLQTRTEAAYICRWPATGPARGRFKNLSRRGVAAAADYRFIVANSDYSYLTGDAAEQLGTVGQARNDVPLLEAALARFTSEPYAEERIRSAISVLKQRAGRPFPAPAARTDPAVSGTAVRR
jgi:hypothetical protein